MVVAPQMRELRTAQTRLNHFLWTTEICYGYVLAQADKHFADLERPIASTMAGVRSHIWFPTSQGRNRFDETTGRFLAQAQESTTELYRLVLVGYYARFEEYLEDRVKNLRRGGTWGPFVRSLASPALRAARVPIEPKTVLCADICRLVRNEVVHKPGSALPISLDDGRVQDWRAKLLTEATQNNWPISGQDIHEATFQVVGQVANHLKDAADAGKQLPPELFYLLFTFTNLDQLACQIEEALLPPNASLSTWVTRPAERVRRPDLIIIVDQTLVDTG
jgi:hypothetical protein